MHKKKKGIIHKYHSSKLSNKFETYNTITRHTHDIVIFKNPRQTVKNDLTELQNRNLVECNGF